MGYLKNDREEETLKVELLYLKEESHAELFISAVLVYN